MSAGLRSAKIVDVGRLRSRIAESDQSLFYAAYGVWLVFSVLNTSMWFAYDNMFDKAMRLVAILILVLYAITKIRDLRYSALACAMLLLVIAGALLGKNTYVIEAAAFILCASKISFDRIARVSCFLLAFAILIVVVPALCGFLENPMLGIGRIRYTLGFKQPPYLSHYLFAFAALMVWTKKEKIGWFTLAGLAFSNVIVFMATDSRNSFIVVWFVIAAGLLGKLKKIQFQKSLIIKACIIASFLVLAFGSVLLSALYDPSISWMYQLDRLLSTRLSLGCRAISEYGITIIGQKVELLGNHWTPEGYVVVDDVYVVDSSFVNMAITQGVLSLAIISAAFTVILWVLLKDGEGVRSLVIVALALHSCVDGQLLLLQFDPFLLLISGLLPGLKYFKSYIKFTVHERGSSNLISETCC